MFKNINTTIAEILLKKGLASKEQLDEAIKEKEKTDESLISVLNNRGIISEEDLLNILSEELKLPLIDLKRATIEKSVVDKVPVRFASWYKFMPVKIEANMLTIAVSSPLEIKIQDEIRFQLGLEIRMVLARQADILEMFKIYYGLGADTVQSMLSVDTSRGKETEIEARDNVEDIEKLAEDASVIKLVNQIILDAYKRRATDIHIEPYRQKVRLRYRIDGVLYDAKVPPEIKVFLRAIISRIKVMSNLNIVEHRLPQDGRAIVKVHEQNLDLRVSCIPTSFGESIVIRVLPTVMLYNLQKLGLSGEDLHTFKTLIQQPNGIIFVTGPTGSGKTTTLYTALGAINTSERKVITIEDPIEYEIEGVMQVQVNPQTGFDFPVALRSILRHDPDIVLVGEVRDLESAEIAIRIALTGHLIFSTLHTNDAASGITRLIDIGIEPYLVASSVKAFIAQRLVRVICPKCKEAEEGLSAEIKINIARELGLGEEANIKTYRGKGCSFCNSTGFYGRTAIYEILLIDQQISEVILRKASTDQIKRIATARGSKSLRQDGWNKVLAGITTPEEIMNVAQGENISYSQGLADKESGEAVKKAESPLRVRGDGGLFKERRVYIRLKNEITLHFKVFKSKEELKKSSHYRGYVSHTEDISAGGLSFLSDEPVSLDSILELTIEVPHNQKKIVCLGKVVRSVRISEEPKRWEVAAYFLDITSVDRARLERHIDSSVQYQD